MSKTPKNRFDTFALVLLAVPFYLTFVGAVAVSRRWFDRDRTLDETARSFGWTLIPIGIAYVLAHNTPLMMVSIPTLIRTISDPFQQGWNLFGTSDALSGFEASPSLAWFIEVGLVVGGHVIGVVAAHRIALRLATDTRHVLKSQYVLTGLMSLYTVVTLWLLSQPLIAQ